MVCVGDGAGGGGGHEEVTLSDLLSYLKLMKGLHIANHPNALMQPCALTSCHP